MIDYFLVIVEGEVGGRVLIFLFSKFLIRRNEGMNYFRGIEDIEFYYSC